MPRGHAACNAPGVHYESDREIRREALDEVPSDDTWDTGSDGSHATTGGAAAAGAVTGGVIGLTGGPVGAAIGAVGGAIVGAAAERMMHSDDGDRPTMSPTTAADEPPTEVEEPIGEPLAEVETEPTRREPRSQESRPLI
jgi:phage tail tape-measure protein